MVFLGYVFLFVVLLPLLAIWRGYVFSILWAWFIIPIFNAPPISIPLAIGFSYIVHHLTERLPKKDDKPFTQKMVELFVFGLIGPLFALIFGWIVHQFA